GAVVSALSTNGWTGAQQAEVMGTGVFNIPVATDGYISAAAFFGFGVPNPSTPCPGVTAAEEYQPQTNPGGVRCGIVDWQRNLLGPRPRVYWGPQEQKIGRAFAGLPIGNDGVQYGLAALNAGQITPAQFVDLNARAGGLNADLQPTPNRVVSQQPALANAYRTGLINEVNNLN